MASPLEQFTIFPIISFSVGAFNLSFTNSALIMLIALLSIILFLFVSVYRGTIVPARWQSIVEMLYEFILDLVNDNLGSKGQRYFPFLFVLFTFILFCNLLGLLPYSFTATSHIIVTFGLAFSIWLGVTLIGLLTHRLHFFSFFFPEGVPLVMAPFIVPIELISYMSRPFSLGLRLFANMLSGHTLFKVMAGFS